MCDKTIEHIIGAKLILKTVRIYVLWEQCTIKLVMQIENSFDSNNIFVILFLDTMLLAELLANQMEKLRAA